jgi:hypothetical protein
MHGLIGAGPPRGRGLTGVLAAALSAFIGGCGDGGPVGGPAIDATGRCATPPSERLQPLVVGATWTYGITDPENPELGVFQRVTTIEALEDVGDRKAGVMAYRQRSVVTPAFRRVALHWSEDDCSSVVRHREKETVPSSFW